MISPPSFFLYLSLLFFFWPDSSFSFSSLAPPPLCFSFFLNCSSFFFSTSSPYRPCFTSPSCCLYLIISQSWPPFSLSCCPHPNHLFLIFPLFFLFIYTSFSVFLLFISISIYLGEKKHKNDHLQIFLKTLMSIFIAVSIESSKTWQSPRTKFIWPHQKTNNARLVA